MTPATTSSNDPQPFSESADIVIVGAGISGMSAAWSLQRQGKRVLVLEARERVGGRTWTGDAPGGPIDYGGMFIGETHHRLIALGRELGLEMTPAVKPGSGIFLIGGEVVEIPEEELPDDTEFATDYRALAEELETLGREIDLAAPWEHPRAAELDAMTVHSWLEGRSAHPSARALQRFAVNAVLGADSAEVSLLYWVYYIAQCEGLGMLLATRGGAQNAWWIGGADQISRRIAEQLSPRVRLSAPVDGIRVDDLGVTVTSGDRSFRAEHVIVAAPPAAVQGIHFEPPLPLDRRELNKRAPLGRMVKVQVRYREAFWLRNGYSGAITDCDETGAFVFDGTKPQDSLAALIGFIGGAAYDEWFSRPEHERRTRLLGVLERLFGPEAATPEYYHETDWGTEEWTGGGPVTFMPPGVLSERGAALRESIGRIHFAGTEASPQWSGYMEGGIRAGEAAARGLSI